MDVLELEMHKRDEVGWASVTDFRNRIMDDSKYMHMYITEIYFEFYSNARFSL